ncbi:MAG TPA: cupredoxin family copper-binding protein [Myxococcota bacterium]|nr:cupredoxin family copper-binding protein [Myxococcota bacterium]
MLGLLLVAAFAGAALPARAASTAPAEVHISNFTFDPPTLAVPVGATVTWVNQDDEPHTVTSAGGGFTSPALDTDESFSFRFDAPGTYVYRCAIHPQMTGKIVVQ